MPYTFSTYRLAELARHKLLNAAAMPDHDYRLLVLHANLLDNLLEKLDQDQDKHTTSTSSQSVLFKRRTREKARDGRREGLAEVVRQHALLHGKSEPIVFLEASGENTVEEGEEEEVPPMLTHESSEDEDEDSGSDFSIDEDDEDGAVLALSAAVQSLMLGDEVSTEKRAWDGRGEGLQLIRMKSRRAVDR